MDSWDVVANVLLVLDPTVQLASAVGLVTFPNQFIAFGPALDWQNGDGHLINLLTRSLAVLLFVVGLLQFYILKDNRASIALKLDFLKVMVIGDTLHIMSHLYSLQGVAFTRWKMVLMFGNPFLTISLLLLRCMFIWNVVFLISLKDLLQIFGFGTSITQSSLASISKRSFQAGKFPERPPTSEGLRARIKKMQSRQL